jgi:hypothetical protein
MELYDKLLKHKTINLETACNDYFKLKKYDVNDTTLCRAGTKFIDYYTFPIRLNVKSKKKMTYLEFVTNKDYLEKPYIKKLIEYQQKKGVNPSVLYWEIFKLHCGSIGYLKPCFLKKILTNYTITTVLDPFMGFGSALVSSSVLDIPKFIGIDLNKSLNPSYTQMCRQITMLGSKTNFELYFQDASTIDYSKFDYDFVITSPPYYSTEIYSDGSNYVYRTNNEWNELFNLVFTQVWLYLKPNGYVCLNIPEKMLNIFVSIFGNKLVSKYPLTNKARYNNNYCEYMYVFQKD